MPEAALPSPAFPPPIALMQCPVAGFQFHGGEACFHRIRVADPVALQREPGNRHDPRAITVQWQGVMLGYVPREANYALSQIIDRGARTEARVASLRAGGNPWQRVMIEVSVHAAPAVVERPKEPEVVVLALPKDLARTEPRLARECTLNAKQRETGLAVVCECIPEIAARLSRPMIGILHDGRREVRLWDTVTLEIAGDGSGLAARSTSGSPDLTVDLRRPLSNAGWITCFLQLIVTVCSRHGLTPKNMPEAMQRCITASLMATFDGRVGFEALRKAALDFLAPDPLARSLANRIFGVSPSAAAFNWVAQQVSALALCAIEHPVMLPFLRLVADDEAMKEARDPLAALRERLHAEGIEPAAWKKLPRWGFGAFERMGEAWWKPVPFARFANLLHHLDAPAAPPPRFVVDAHTAAYYRAGRNAQLNFERHPAWFMRALLRAREAQGHPDTILKSPIGLCHALDWLIDTRPEPDANQQRAGWPWITDQAQAYRKARALELAAPWEVPVAGMSWGPYRVVAIDRAAALEAEAQAMKNCLATYEEACRSGEIAMYSIRERSTGARVACFAAERTGDSWQLVDVAGKMNAPVDEETERIGHAMVAKLNGGRGGEVPPF